MTTLTLLMWRIANPMNFGIDNQLPILPYPFMGLTYHSTWKLMMWSVSDVVTVPILALF